VRSISGVRSSLGTSRTSKTSRSTGTKASIASAYLVVLLIFKHFTLHVYNIANYKDILAIDDNYLVSEGFYCIWVEVLVL